MTENKLTKVARILLGLIVLVFGLNGFLQFMPAPESVPEAAIAFFTGMTAIVYFMPLLSILFLLIGISLLIRKWVPLSLLILATISVNIVLYHLFVQPSTIWFGLVVFLLNLYLGIKHMPAYRPLFDLPAGGTSVSTPPEPFSDQA